MAQVSVTLVRADTNQEFDVELPDDAAVVELLPALVKELGLPLTGPDGNQIAYELSNKRTGQELKEDQTLGTASTKTGDVLLLTSTFVAGAGVKLELDDREAYLMLHAVDEAARREGTDSDRGRELFALADRFSKAGASFVFPPPQE